MIDINDNEEITPNAEADKKPIRNSDIGIDNEVELTKAEAVIAVAEAERIKARAELAKAEAEIAKAEAEVQKLKLREKIFIEERRDVEKDRRQKEPLRDYQGNINEKTYKGIDRRSGVDRREHEKDIRRDYRNFILRSVAYSGTIGIVLISAFFLLFTPEYMKVKEYIKTTDFKQMTASVDLSAFDDFSLSAFLSRRIGKVEDYVDGVTSAVKGLDDVKLADASSDLSTIGRVFSDLNKINAHSDNDSISASDAARGVKNLVVSALTSNPDEVKETLMNATDYDATLRKVLTPIKSKNITAAALLFALDTFRDNIYSGNSYESDITLIKKLAGDDPEVNEAINQLSPYAKSGIMSKQVLASEFKSLANDIIIAKAKGEDANIKEKALARFEHLKEQARQKQLSGDDDEAVVARAQVMLDQGNIQGAMEELQKLQNTPSISDSEWITNAAQTAAAEMSSDYVVQQLVNNIAQDNNLSAESLIKMIIPSDLINDRPVYLSPKRR